MAKKYQGKFAGRAPRRARCNKAALLVMSILLLIGMTVGGTAALLLTKTEPETNTFQISYVTCKVNTRGSGSTIDVTNPGATSAYIRAAVVVNWMDADGNVRGIAPTAEEYALILNTGDWAYYADGYYYYTAAVAPGATTNDLVTAVSVNAAAPEGYELAVQVTAEAIQATGDTDDGAVPAYQDAWGITGLGN